MNETGYLDDPLSAARGIMFGLALSGPLWALLIAMVLVVSGAGG